MKNHFGFSAGVIHMGKKATLAGFGCLRLWQGPAQPVLCRSLLCLLSICLATAAPPRDPAAARASKQFDLIDSGRAKPGSVIVLTPAELNAWARERLPEKINGVREPRITLGMGTATVAMLVDFVKLRAVDGVENNSAFAKLFEGERLMRVSARLESGGGRAAVHLSRAEIGGAAITGSVLDFVVGTLLRPMFPEAHINEPFDLGANVERIDIRPRDVRVTIKR